jgi:hypothetical protein
MPSNTDKNILTASIITEHNLQGKSITIRNADVSDKVSSNAVLRSITMHGFHPIIYAQV